MFVKLDRDGFQQTMLLGGRILRKNCKKLRRFNWNPNFQQMHPSLIVWQGRQSDVIQMSDKGESWKERKGNLSAQTMQPKPQNISEKIAWSLNTNCYRGFELILSLKEFKQKWSFWLDKWATGHPASKNSFQQVSYNRGEPAFLI